MEFSKIDGNGMARHHSRQGASFCAPFGSSSCLGCCCQESSYLGQCCLDLTNAVEEDVEVACGSVQRAERWVTTLESPRHAMANSASWSTSTRRRMPSWLMALSQVT